MVEGAEQSSVRILVVDDEGPVRRSVVRLLRHRQFEVAECPTPEVALAALEQVAISAVICDINMPNMNGIALLRELRAKAPDLPVIFMTGMPNLDTAIEAVSLGAFGYLIKPFEPAELLESVQRAVSHRQIAGLRRLANSSTALAGRGESLQRRFDLAESQLWLAFQPLVRGDAPTRPVGFEALLRSGDPILRRPEHIFTAADRLGRIESLNRRVQEMAAAAMASARPEELLFLNLPPRSLLDDSLLDGERAFVRLANRVVLEITERSTVEGIPDLRSRVDRLREHGYRIAIDDIGAGYAGLASFVALQPEYVKLDLSLVRDVDSAPLKRTLVESMIQVSHELGVEVIAEGVESEGEFEALRAMDCDLFQGYHIGKPARGLTGPDASASTTSA